jgi:hypothetical protein
MIKITALHQILRYKTFELVIKSEPKFSFDHYGSCPISILGSSNSILTEKRIHYRAWEQPPTRISVQNVDEGEEEKKCAT